MGRKHQKKPTVPTPRSRSSWAGWKSAVVCCLLVLAVALVFGQTLGHPFVNYDDNDYVYENVAVQHGLSGRAIAWAFKSFHSHNWHPFTWLSHLLDVQLYGMNSWGHHLSNILLHAASAILLFLVLRRMTDRLWPCAFAAALFAIHPLRVESVAWVAERKDILSGLFFMLTLWAYAGYARRPFSLIRYLSVIVLFALGLMCKPMLVTLPFVLLLLDYWPLGRVTIVKPRPVVAVRDATTGRGFTINVGYLLLEKLPLFVLSAISCVVTAKAQGTAIATLDSLSPAARVANSLVAYMAHLGQLFWPASLSVFYPYPENLPILKAVAAAVLLLGISAVFLVYWRRFPYLLVGWLWYLGMMVPTIGLVQVGEHAMADRYTYLPQIGLAIAMTWGMAQATARWPSRRWICGLASAIILASLMLGAWRQTNVWRSSETLWRHALACNEQNSRAHNNLGFDLVDRGHVDEAIAHYHRSLAVKPNKKAYNNLGTALFRLGKVEDSMAQLRRALEMDNNYLKAHYNLATILMGRGETREAIVHFRKALEIDSDFTAAQTNLGAVLQQSGRIDEAIECYQRALRLEPDDATAQKNLAVATSQRASALKLLAKKREEIRARPNDVVLLNEVAWLMATCPMTSMRNGPEAVQLAERVVALTGGREPAVLGTLAAAQAEAGRYADAVQTARRALDLAVQQNKQSLADSIRAKMSLYEAKTPFRETATTTPNGGSR